MLQTEGGFTASFINGVKFGVSTVADLSGEGISNSTKSCFLPPAQSDLGSLNWRMNMISFCMGCNTDEKQDANNNEFDHNTSVSPDE